MTRKPTPYDFALWAALPMAHTSQIEGRLKMILDASRSRRALTRGILVTALGVGAIALLPLAMLRPAARAQGLAAPAASVAASDGSTLELASITDSLGPEGKAWGADGKPLTGFPLNSNAQNPKLSVPPGQRGLFFSFHVPGVDYKTVATQYEVQGAVPGSLTMTYAAARGKASVTTTMQGLVMASKGIETVAAAMPASLARTSILAGIASGPWTQIVTCPKTPGKVRIQKPSGEVIFTLLRHPRPQDGAAFMVSDHFRAHSPLAAQNALQTDLHDAENYQRSVFALDRLGHSFYEVRTGGLTWPDEAGRIKTMQTAHIPAAVLTRTAAFRLVARPYRWTEFKDVALQPDTQAASAPAVQSAESGPEAATARLQQIYGFLQTYRRTHGGAFPVTNSPGLLGDMTVHPQTYGLPDRGAGNAAQAQHLFTSPDSQFMDGGSEATAGKLIVYFLHNKRPDGTLVGTAKRAGTRDEFASTPLFVRNHSRGATGFYLVLWDDGTVSRIPTNSILTVPVYDVIGDGKQAMRDGVKQIAFPGQAGLPRS